MELPNWLLENSTVILHAVGSAFAMLIVLLIIVRINGLRSFAKFTPIDFAVTVCIGSILSSVIMNDSTSLLKGVVIIGVLLGFQSLYGLVKRLLPNIYSKKLSNRPIYLYKNGAILDRNLQQVNMTKNQLYSKIRLNGYGSLQEIKYIILESTGDISFISNGKKIDTEIFSEL